MFRRVPIVACSISAEDLSSGVKGLFSGEATQALRTRLGEYLKRKNVYFFNSATSAFFSLLRVLREKSPAREVVLPAYTASSLVHAIKRAGLKPVLCDISLNDFDSDLSLLLERISSDTLAVLWVHMYGIVGRDLEHIRAKSPGVVIVEDGAQSFGSRVNGDMIGRGADASFFSFNRGKNIPAYGGGCLVTNRDDLTGRLKEEEAGLRRRGVLARAAVLLKIAALSLLMKPCVYGALFPLLSLLKGKPAREDFEVAGWTGVQAAVVLSFLGRLEGLSRRRFDNGRRLIQGLASLGDAVILPELSEGAQSAFNRLPVVFRDAQIRGTVSRELWKKGIETSRMYLRPLHHAFDLGYRKEEFPCAVTLAEGLLTLPVHPLVTDRDIDTMCATIKKVLG